MKQLYALFSLPVALAFVLAGCDSSAISKQNDNRSVAEVRASDAHMVSTTAASRFPAFHQGFNDDLTPWIDGSKAGPLGWCGSIERIDRRTGVDPKPSAGRGYAVVRHGPCNEFWQSLGFEDSAPASLDPELLSTTWPSSGFVQEFDIYLDPAAYSDGAVFSVAGSVCVLSDEGSCFPSEGGPEFHYFPVHASKDDGNMFVAGKEVETAGWYTFRYVFGSDAGTLTVDFELANHGRPLAAEPIVATLLSGRQTSSFDVSDLGSGYVWFSSIAEGLGLPIDEHMLRQGK